MVFEIWGWPLPSWDSPPERHPRWFPSLKLWDRGVSSHTLPAAFHSVGWRQTSQRRYVTLGCEDWAVVLPTEPTIILQVKEGAKPSLKQDSPEVRFENLLPFSSTTPFHWSLWNNLPHSLDVSLLGKPLLWWLPFGDHTSAHMGYLFTGFDSHFSHVYHAVGLLLCRRGIHPIWLNYVELAGHDMTHPRTSPVSGKGRGFRQSLLLCGLASGKEPPGGCSIMRAARQVRVWLLSCLQSHQNLCWQRWTGLQLKDQTHYTGATTSRTAAVRSSCHSRLSQLLSGDCMCSSPCFLTSFSPDWERTCLYIHN